MSESKPKHIAQKKTISKFSQHTFMLDGRYYRVEDMPSHEKEEQFGPDAFKRANAYRYHTDMCNLLLPYRGVLHDPDEFCYDQLEVGIWHVEIRPDHYVRKIVFPRNKSELKKYHRSNETELATAVLGNEFTLDQFIDPVLESPDSGTSLFRPPIHADDDSLNMLIKVGIRNKNSNFAPYAKRLAAFATEKFHGIEGANARNNARRALNDNRAMSPTKAQQYAEVFQMDLAYIIKDSDDAMHHMLPPGKMFVVYPSGKAFPIKTSDLIDISPYVETAVSEYERGVQYRKEQEDES